MSGIHRRDLLKALAAAPAAGGLHLTSAMAQQAHQHAQESREAEAQGEPAALKFFTEDEFKTARILADLILPADDRSPSASQVGVPEFMDFIMTDMPYLQTGMRGGLSALDFECQKRFGLPFRECDDPQRTALLDDIAWPAKAKPELSQLASFFSAFRDLTASGFWTTKAGMEDLQYLGNTFVDEWTGCPPEALKKLGVEYDGE